MRELGETWSLLGEPLQVGADSQVLEYEGRRSLTVSRGGDEAWRGLMTRPQAGRPVPSPRGRPLACVDLHLGIGLCMRVQERGNFAWERLRASCGFDWRAMRGRGCGCGCRRPCTRAAFQDRKLCVLWRPWLPAAPPPARSRPESPLVLHEAVLAREPGSCFKGDFTACRGVSATTALSPNWPIDGFSSAFQRRGSQYNLS